MSRKHTDNNNIDRSMLQITPKQSRALNQNSYQYLPNYTLKRKKKGTKIEVISSLPQQELGTKMELYRITQ
jgi:hypothetical protein